MTTIVYCETPQTAQAFAQDLRREGNNETIRIVSPTNFNGDCEPYAETVYAVNVTEDQAEALTLAYEAKEVEVQLVAYGEDAEADEPEPAPAPRKRRTKTEIIADRIAAMTGEPDEPPSTS